MKTVVVSVVDVTSVFALAVLTRALALGIVVVASFPVHIRVVSVSTLGLNVVTGVVVVAAIVDVSPVVTSLAVRWLVETGLIVVAPLVLVIFVVSDDCAEAKAVACVLASAAVVVKFIVVM